MSTNLRLFSTASILHVLLCGLGIPVHSFTEPSNLVAHRASASSRHRVRGPVQVQQLRAANANSIPTQSPDADNDEAASPPSPSRRRAVSSLLLLTAPFLLSSRASLAVPDSDDSKSSSSGSVFLKGTATLQNGVESQLPEEGVRPGSALYVTARPNRPDNVPRAILDGSRGKPPPVLAGRFADPTFPFDFTLTRAELTPEGATTEEDSGEGGGGGKPLWWEGEDLVVSARLDSDGVAATRDPTDLVGRSVFSASKGGAEGAVTIELQGRGIFGKSVTGKSKK